MERTYTNRGFKLLKFKDYNNTECSLQESSLAFEDCVWLGVDDAQPQIMVSEAVACGIDISDRTGEELNGWMPYYIPDKVMLTTRMHLTREQAKELVKELNNFIKTGRLK